LRRRAREWLRRLQPAPADWTELRTLILQKYGNVDDNDIRAKLDAINQEPRERVQRYFEHLDRFFRKGRISDAEQKRRFLAKLRPEIRKLCVVRNFADIEELLGAANEVERMLGELGETPFEPLKGEQDERIIGMSMESPIAVLNNALINFLEESVPNPISSFSPAVLIECQICEGRDHIAMTCPRLNAPWPKCARCGGPHRITSCGMEHLHCSSLRHSEGMYWRRPNEGKSHMGEANFLGALLSGEKATTVVEGEIPERRSVHEHVKVMKGTNVVTGRKLLNTITPCEEPRAEINDPKTEKVEAVDDEVRAKVGEVAKRMVSDHEEGTSRIDVQIKNGPQVRITQDGTSASLIGAEMQLDQVPLIENINVKNGLDAEVADPFPFVMSPTANEEHDEQLTAELVEAIRDLKKTATLMTRNIATNDRLVIPNSSSAIHVPMIGQCSRDHEDNILLTVSRNAYKQDPYMQEFGISNNNRMANVEARTLPHHQLSYHDTSWEECIPSVEMRNMMQKKMVHGGSMRYWTCINFSRYITVEIAPQLCNELIEICQTSGVVFEMNPMLTIQYAGPELGDGASCTDLERAKAVVPEKNLLFPNMEAVVLNRDVSQDKFEETSKVAGLTDEHEERPRPSAISEDIHSATSKSKEIVVGPEAALSDCGV
jgi:hypothetical protein